MSTTFSIHTLDGEVQVPRELTRFSNTLAEHIAVTFDVEVDEVPTLDDEGVEETPVFMPVVSTNELLTYMQWVEAVGDELVNSKKLAEYVSEWKEQMQLQKPHETPVCETLPDRVDSSWTLDKLVSEETKSRLESFMHWGFDQIVHDTSDTPEASPFNNPPEWHLNLSDHELPEYFPREMLPLWLKKYHFIDLNGLEIPADLTLNAYLRMQRLGEEEQQQTEPNPEHPIVIDYICDHIGEVSMPEIQPIVPDSTIADPDERRRDVEIRRAEMYEAAIKRIRDTIFIPTKFPSGLEEEWLAERLDLPEVIEGGNRVSVTPEQMQHYHERNHQHLRAEPHLSDTDPSWGLGAEIGKMVLLGEKMGDDWLTSAAQWRLSELADYTSGPIQHMRLMKYYHNPRTEQFMQTAFFYR